MGMAQLKSEERQLFTDTNFVVLATTRKDGRPRSVVLWVDVDGDDILINGGRSREWIKNLRRDPRVALAIFDRQEPYRYVSVQGTVTTVTDEGADEHYASLREKYRGVSPNRNRQQASGAERPPSERRTLVRVRPDRIISRGTG
jgi:PPOX class probable F420-dependent enzyme